MDVEFGWWWWGGSCLWWWQCGSLQTHFRIKPNSVEPICGCKVGVELGFLQPDFFMILSELPEFDIFKNNIIVAIVI